MEQMVCVRPCQGSESAMGKLWVGCGLKVAAIFVEIHQNVFRQLDMKTQARLTICGVLAIFDTAGTRKMLCTTLYTRTIYFKVVGLMHLTLTMATKCTMEL